MLVVDRDQRRGFVDVGIPESPGHLLECAPGHDRESVSVERDHIDRVAAPATGLPVWACCYVPGSVRTSLLLSANWHLDADVQPGEEPRRGLHQVGPLASDRS